MSFICNGGGFVRIVLFMDLHFSCNGSKASLISRSSSSNASNLLLIFSAKSIKAVVEILFLILSKTNLVENSRFTVRSTVAK